MDTHKNGFSCSLLLNSGEDLALSDPGLLHVVLTILLDSLKPLVLSSYVLFDFAQKVFCVVSA